MCLILSDKSCHSAALCTETFHINLRIQDAMSKTLGFRKNLSVFRNDVVPGEHQILCRLSLSRRRINICRKKTCRLATYQFPAVTVFAGQFIRSRQIHQNRRPRQCMGDTRRIRCPQILTQFHTDSEFRHLLTDKKQIPVRRNTASVRQNHLCRKLCSGYEMSRLIKFIVIRQITLRYKSKHFSMGKHCRHIV